MRREFCVIIWQWWQIVHNNNKNVCFLLLYRSNQFTLKQNLSSKFERRSALSRLDDISSDDGILITIIRVFRLDLAKRDYWVSLVASDLNVSSRWLSWWSHLHGECQTQNNHFHSPKPAPDIWATGLSYTAGLCSLGTTLDQTVSPKPHSDGSDQQQKRKWLPSPFSTVVISLDSKSQRRGSLAHRALGSLLWTTREESSPSQVTLQADFVVKRTITSLPPIELNTADLISTLVAYLFWSGSHISIIVVTVHALLHPCMFCLLPSKETHLWLSLRPGVSLLKCSQCHMVTAALQPLNWLRKSILVILRSVSFAWENEVQAAATSSTPTQPA